MFDDTKKITIAFSSVSFTFYLNFSNFGNLWLMTNDTNISLDFFCRMYVQIKI